MITLLFTLMVLSGIVLIGSILLMAPKWWLWFWVGGMNTSNEYGSKKSLEWTLKASAIFSVLIFTLCAIVYPYIAKKELSTWTSKNQVKQSIKQLKINPKDIKINWVNSKDLKIESKKNTNLGSKKDTKTSENK